MSTAVMATNGNHPQKIKIAIAGGGISGLALAVGLLHNPALDVHIYESVPEYKDVGAGLALHMNAIKAMDLIDPKVKKVYFDKALSMGEENQEMVTEVMLAQGDNQGTLVGELGRAKGRKTVSRADLLDGLLELVPEECISFGMRLASIQEDEDGDGVRVTFKDGTEINVDCLLGADGIHSTTRAYLLGADHPATGGKNHDGWQIYRTMVSMDDARKAGMNERWSKVVPILLGPKGHINCMALNLGTRLSAGVAVRRGANLAHDGAAQDLDPALYSDYSDDAKSIVELVAKDTSASWTPADHDHAPFYHKGRVAMMGDAAHASLPFAGNGAAQALEDSAVLSHLFSVISPSREDGVDVGTQIELALEAYDTVRRPRSQKVVDLARQYGRVYAYAEKTEDCPEGLHTDPKRMMKVRGSAFG